MVASWKELGEMEKFSIQSRTNLNGGELERIKPKEKDREATLRTALNLVSFVY